jgi:tetratricopeptide (TPR) repeat protein
MGAMGDFFSDSNNGPAILLIILIVDVVVVLGGFYLLSKFLSARVIKRSAHILRLTTEGHTDAARELATEWDRADRPRSPFARVNLAKVWFVLGEHKRALSVLDATKIPNSRACRPLRRIAAHVRYDALRGLGENERAEWFLRDQAAIDPTAPWLAFSRWETATTGGDVEAAGAALADVRALFAKHPKDEAVLAALAQDAFTGHRYADAADLLERLVRRLDRPGARRLTRFELYLLLGMAQVAVGRDAAADESFRTFVERSSDPADAERRVLGTRAGAYLVAGRLDEATRAYQQLVADGQSADAHVGLAMCVLRRGDPARAAHLLDRAEELGYPPEKGRLLRAQILVDQGKGVEADRLARQAASDLPSSNPEALYTLAYVFATAHLPGAEETLRRYVELQPYDPDLAPLLDRPGPDGRTWRERLEVASRPDTGTEI